MTQTHDAPDTREVAFALASFSLRTEGTTEDTITVSLLSSGREYEIRFLSSVAEDGDEPTEEWEISNAECAPLPVTVPSSDFAEMGPDARTFALVSALLSLC